MVHLYTYGTLSIPEVMQAVTGKSFKSQTANLDGYQRYSLKHRNYPAIIRCDNACVEGRIHFDVDEESWRLLDEFEDCVYDRVETLVTLADGQTLDVCAYVLQDDKHHLLAHPVWSEEAFREQYLPDYLSRIGAR